MNYYKLILIILTIGSFAESFSMNAKRKHSDDGNTQQEKRRKVEGDVTQQNSAGLDLFLDQEDYSPQPQANYPTKRSLSACKQAQSAIKHLNDALTRCKTDQNWPKRKELIINAYKQNHIDLNLVQYKHQFSHLNPLSEAIDQADEQFVRWLLGAGMRADHVNALGSPVICYATKIGIVEALLEAGAKLDTKDAQGESLAMYAVMKNFDPELLQLYGAYGFASAESSRPGETPLSRLVFHAAGYKTKHLETLKAKGRYLIEHGATTKDPIYNGKTFDQLVRQEIESLERNKVYSANPERYTRDIAKLQALSQAVHQAMENQPKRFEHLQQEINQNLILLPSSIRQLISDFAQ